jgi:signal transduction histidine kinase
VVGISVEDQPRLFRQFVQFNRNALQGGGGSGLGWWICKNLATFHGGRMVGTQVR